MNKITYTEESEPKKRPQTAKKSANTDTFNYVTKTINSRPCPSISLSKANIMKRIR